MQTEYRWLTVDQAAAELQVTPTTVLRWIKDGKLAASKLGRKSYRISAENLEAFMKGEK